MSSAMNAQSDEVHVHGYDLEKPVGPVAPTRFSFSADIASPEAQPA